MSAHQSFRRDETVLDAARRRIAFVFDHFEHIVVSVSGGKDSTVLAHLALTEARSRARRIGLFFLDEEVVYEATVAQVDYLMDLMPEATTKLWLQIPFRLTNATSATESQLVCWEPGKHKLWMRPKKSFGMAHAPWDRAIETVRNRAKGFGFYDALENFERTYTGAAFLVGLRAAGESPNRWRAVTRNPIDVGGQRVYWGTRKGANHTLYPVYDWNYFDVWRYIHDEGLRYHKAYDWMFREGVHPGEMRVSSLIHERSFHALCSLPSFEPKTYDRLLKRVKGIALAQETAKAATLFRATKLPKNFASWRTYRDHLIATSLDPAHVPLFAKRFARQRDNEYVARQQCRQLVLNDYENNLGIDDADDPRDAMIAYYREVL